MTNGKARPGGALPSSAPEPPDSTQALRARRAELEAVIDGTPFMLARLSRDMRYRFISRAYARMIDRRPEEVLGKHVVDVLGPEGFAAVRPYIEKVLHGEPVEYELEIRFPDVGSRYLRGFYTPETDAAGNVDGWIASLMDVGDRRRADEVRQQLANIVGSSGDAIYSEDRDGIIVSWNRGAERLYGYSAEEAVGMSIALVIPPELRQEEPKILVRVAEGEQIDHYETVRRRKDGTLIDVSLTISPVRNAEGAIVGASKIARDITERRQADRTLAKRAEEQRALYEFTNRLYRAESLAAVYEAALDAIRDALRCSRASILRFDEHVVMRFVAWRGLSDDYRRAVEGHSPWSPADVNPEPVCLADVGTADLPAALSEVIAREGIGSLAFIPIVAQGRLVGKFMTYYGAAHAFASDEIDLALNLARQLGFAIERMEADAARQAAEQGLRALSERLETEVERRTLERDLAQRQAAQSQKMEALGQLTGGVAHDFNNLLMIVSGHAQRLQRRLNEPRDVRALEAIQIAATRGEGLTRQLLAFSRSQPLNPTVISPADTITGIRDVLAGSLHVNIAVALDVPETIWPVRVDKSEIELALVNLVVNARDAMPEGGRLSIVAENVRLAPEDGRDGLAGDFVALRVGDTGCGIPGDIVAKVFEPFFTTKAAEKGTGLGLSQVYGFARRSGGTVAIASEVGRGTTVTLYLPRSHGQVERPATDDAGQLLAVGEETVLVVEDNEDVRAVAVSLLEQLGYRTEAVDCASAALARLAAGEFPDLIFTDVVLPGDMDGLALARAVKERHPNVPAVLTTGYAKIFDADPEFPVLRKPYQIAALARVIRAALDAAKLARPALAG